MQILDRKLQSAMRAAYQEAGVALGRDTTDEMAVPAYLETGPISRYVFWRKLDFVLQAAKLQPRARVFDFGCGTGVLLPRLAADGRTVLATDHHPEIAQVLVRRLEVRDVTFLADDAWQEQIEDDSLDTIIAANVLEHIDERTALLRLFSRKLRHNGRVVISGPTENALYRLGRRLIGFTGDYHVSNVKHVFADAESSGLRQVYDKAFPLPGPLCLYRIAAFTR